MRLITTFCSSIALVFACAAPASAQIFDKATNLKVLPESTTPRELRAIMRGFAGATGLRCDSCHVGEPGQDLKEFDFASDEKEKKQIARDMMRMVNAINGDEHLGKFEGDTLQVTCQTCHRGVAVPRSTQQELRLAFDDGGADAMVGRYEELRERYYGSGSYDFGQSVLSSMAEQIGLGGDLNTAERLLNLNLEHFPKSFHSYYLLGELKFRSGDKAAARGHWEKALEVGDDERFERFVQQRLDQLDG